MSSSEDDIREIPNLLEKNLPRESILSRIMERNTQDLSNKDDDIQQSIGGNNEVDDVASALIAPPEPPVLFADVNSPAPILTLPSGDVHGVELCFSTQEETVATQESDAVPIQRSSSLTVRRRYRIHLGTRPGFYQSKLFTYEQSEWRHEQLINLLSQFRSNLDNLRLKYFQFNILLSNAVSTTEAWGLEPYASIIFESCDLVIVEGVAAIIGRIFRQDGIGIFEEGDDYQAYRIGTTADNFDIHRFFAISQLHGSQNLSIPNEDASKMMLAIREKHPDLSGQFGRSRETIELHDYRNLYGTETIMNLKTIVEEVFPSENHTYRIEESRTKSKLLLEAEYDAAIQRADFELLAAIVQTVRLHDTLYNSN